MKIKVWSEKIIDISKQVSQFKKAIAAWTDNGHFDDNEDGGAHMKKAYAMDRKDLKNVLALLKNGKFTEAGKAADRLDTIVREQIPQSVWNMIHTD